MATEFYLGNPNLKAVGVQIPWTSDTFNEYAKCSQDPVYFAKQYVKIVSVDQGLIPFNMWPFQEEMMLNMVNNRFSIAKMPRQVGKCCKQNTYILLRKDGVSYPITIGNLYEQISEMQTMRQRNEGTKFPPIQDPQNQYPNLSGTISRSRNSVKRTTPETIGKIDGRQESGVSAWWEAFPIFQEFSWGGYFQRNSEKSFQDQIRQWEYSHDDRLLAQANEWGYRKSGSPSEKQTTNIQFGSMYCETWSREGSRSLVQETKNVAGNPFIQTTRRTSGHKQKKNSKQKQCIQSRNRINTETKQSWLYSDAPVEIRAQRYQSFLLRHELWKKNHRIQWGLLARQPQKIFSRSYIQPVGEDFDCKGNLGKRQDKEPRSNISGVSGFCSLGNELYEEPRARSPEVSRLSDEVERKFINSLPLEGIDIWTDSGWHPASSIHKTIEYKEWVLKTKTHELTCADDHIVFLADGEEAFVKNLRTGDKIKTESGPEEVVSITETDLFSNMFDITVESGDHSFYTNGILSHNTTVTAAVILWHILFSPNYSVAVLANKEPQAIEILTRIKDAYEFLPIWMQQGVVEWNKKTIVLENGSKIIAAATSSSAIRGRSMNCVTGETIVTICDDYDQIFNIEIQKANSSKYIMDNNLMHWKEPFMYYTVYKITNLINNKEYIGYHQTNNLDDGYMGSGKLIKRAVKKYGIENFQKEYISIFDNREDAESLEAILVSEEYSLREDTYNICLGGNVRIMMGKNNPWYGKKHKQETIDSIRNININKNQTTEDDIVIDGIKYHSFYHLANSLDMTIGQLKNKMLEPNNGYINQNRQKNLSEYMKQLEKRKLQNKVAKSIMMKEIANTPRTDEWKKNISNALTGKEKTKEHTNKINKNPEKIRKTAEKNTGSKRSEETKRKMSELKKGKPAKNKGKICIYNKENYEVKTIIKTQIIPEGWSRGTGPRNKPCQKS